MKIEIKKNGFTLVETLVAIAILMIAVAGPLTIANQAMTAALSARNAMIATYLAQDAMESIKNIKDNNVSLGLNFLNNLGSGTCTSGTVSQACQTPNAWTNGVFWSGVAISCGSNTGCKLYTDSTHGYSYNSVSTSLTAFTRYYYLTGSANDTVVTVTVSWKDGSVPNAVTLQELMSNSPR